MPSRVIVEKHDKYAMSKSKIRTISAVLLLKQFTVEELSQQTGLSANQIRPVLRELRLSGVVKDVGVVADAEARPSHRPPKSYALVGTEEQLASLTDEVYQLRRALQPKVEIERFEMSQLECELTDLEVLLDITDSAVKVKPLSRKQMQTIERRMQAAYTHLESLTYRSGADIKQEDREGGILAHRWTQWQGCAGLFDRLIDTWARFPEKTPLGSFLSHLAQPIKTIRIVTDSRFVDSALFLWIFSEQPFRAANLEIECIPEIVDWADIPQTVAAHPYSLGFYNRREDKHHSSVAYWTDLSIYRGYSIVAHKMSSSDKRPATIKQSGEFLERYLKNCEDKGMTPTIISIGADTSWRFGDNLTPDIPWSLFRNRIIQNATEALAEFLKSPHALFIGGLPQRLQAEDEGCISILDFDHNPKLFSVNGLLYNTGLGQSGSSVLQAASALWFDTISKLKKEAKYREEVAASIKTMLTRIQTPPLWKDSIYDQLFTDDKFEFFPEAPADIADYYVELQSGVLKAELRKLVSRGRASQREISVTATTVATSMQKPLERRPASFPGPLDLPPITRGIKELPN
jgi:hypothetical protein